MMNVYSATHHDDEVQPFSAGRAVQPTPGDTTPNPYMEATEDRSAYGG